MTDRPTLFAQWAASYDVDVRNTDFPFEGYDDVLRTIVERAEAQEGQRVLDVGVGTGNLAALFVQRGCVVTGADFAPEMLQQTAQKLPGVRLLPLDLTSKDWASLVEQRFERIVAAYVLHEFSLADAIAILRRLAADHLLPGGRIVFGDIAFPTVALREEAARFWAQWWDSDEHYWAADEALPALEAAGFVAAYGQVSACAGVFQLSVRNGSVYGT